MTFINDICNLIAGSVKASVARKQKEQLHDRQVVRKQLFDSQIDDTINLISDTVSTVFNQLDKIRENQTHRFLLNFVGTYEACYPNEILDMVSEMESNNCSHNSDSGNNGDNDDKGRYNKNVEDLKCK